MCNLFIFITYVQYLLASIMLRWEQDFNYCDQIRKINIYKKGNRLLDLIDAAVFDYLIGNADRHHYEVFADFPDSIVILLDNGKR